MSGLTDYQISIAQNGAEILGKHKILMLLMEMRTRKTTTTYAILDLCKFKSVLFLTKKKAIPSIISDYFFAPHDYELKVINYESIHKLDPNFTPDCIVLDESHCLGAFPKRVNKVNEVKNIVGDKPVIFLTATPTPESYSQIFHQLYVSKYSPFAKYSNFYRWAADHVIAKKKFIGSMQVNDYSKAKVNIIQSAIRPFCISLTQQEAGFEAIAEDRIVTVPVPQNVKYIREELEMHEVCYYLDKVVSTNGPADLMQKMSQLAGGTLIFDNDTDGTILSDFKIQYIKDNFKGKKIAILYKYKAERRLLLNSFPNVTESPEDFQNSLDPDLVFIGQFVSTREGVNLASADYLVMYNIDHSATTYFQSRARIQTLTRTKPAIVFWLFTAGGIEHKIYKMVSKKKNFTASHYKKISNS